MKRSSKIILTSIAMIGIGAATVGAVSAKGPCGGYSSQAGFEDSGHYASEYGYGGPGWRHQGPGRHHGGVWSKGCGY